VVVHDDKALYKYQIYFTLLRMLSMTFLSDLSLDKYASSIFVSPSSMVTGRRVHAFVTSRVDYCNMVLAGAPTSVTDRLQRVLNAAACLVSGTRKYDHGLSQLLHADLHCLDVADRVRYKLAVTVHHCLHNNAEKYLTDCCVAVSDIAGRQRLHSAHRRQLDVQCCQRTTLGRRAFSVAGPTVWNMLPVELRDETENNVRQSLKTLLFRQY